MNYPPSKFQDCKDYTVVLPAVSVSNVGQLAVDLLIQSSEAEKISNIWHNAFIPLIAAHPFKEDSANICTEFEVYRLQQFKVLFLQFRSPVWKSREEDFLNDLINMLKEIQTTKIIILSSLYDYERTDNQIKKFHVRCCVCPFTQSVYTSILRALNCSYLELKNSTDNSGIMSEDMFLPGAGFTKALHLKCIKEGLACVSLFKFCSDGDNTPEALELARIVDEWLNIVPGNEKRKTFIHPPSWKFIFGGPSPQELFP